MRRAIDRRPARYRARHTTRREKALLRVMEQHAEEVREALAQFAETVRDGFQARDQQLTDFAREMHER